MAIVTLMTRTIAPLRSSAKPARSGSAAAGPVVEHREARQHAARALQRGRADRVHEHEPLGVASPRRHGGGRRTIEPNECPSRMYGARRADRADERAQPVGVGVDVVRSARKRRRLAEPGQVGRDDADAGQLRDDGLEAVVVAAEAVHGTSTGGIRRAVLPVGGRRCRRRRSRCSHGDASELLGVGGGDHVPVILRRVA